MGLETGTYISDLNTSNPAAGDAKSAGDDHLRLIKSTVKATFPNITGAVTPTHTELNYVDGVTSNIQAQFASVISQIGSVVITGDLPAVAVTTTGDSAKNTLELCAATSAIVRTIPTGTAVGDVIGYKDNGQLFATYSLTITPPTGHSIEDLAANETLVVTTNYLAFTLRQVSSGLWRIF